MLQATARRVNRQTAPVVSLQLLKQLDAASLRRYGSTSSSTSTSCALLQQPRGRAAFRHGSLIHAHGSSGIPLSLLQSRFQSTEARPSSGGATAVPPPPPPYTSDKAKRAAGASLQPDSSSEKATAAKVSASLDGAESAAALGAASKEKSGTVASTASTTAKDKKEVGKPKERLTTRVWKKIKHEANHYWNGTKLLGKEIKISARLQYKLLQGKSLTRREKRQLKRTTQDLLRLIPFIPFLVIPFMELLLPVALKIFPNMLPSTFEDKHAADEKKRKLLKVRIEMAKFLQETIRESGLANDPEKIKQSEEFRTFFRKVRSTGEQPSTDDIVKVARLFQDDLTLDNLSRPQLVSMCRYMNINAFGTDNFLRYTIRSRMAKLEKDDKLIQTEGVDSLSATELAHACASRGIRTSSANSPEEKQRAELGQWIDLHLKHNLSGTLLILSKAFAFTEKPDGTIDHLSSLKHTLSSLPDTLLNETELGMLSDEEDKAFKQRLEVLQEQEELIEDEAEQEQEEEEARKMRKQQQEEAEEAARAAAAESGAAQTSAATPEGNPVAPGLSEVEVEREKFEAEREQAKQMLPDEMAAQTDTATATLAGDAPASAAKKDAKMTTEQLTELGEALSILSARSSVRRERQDLAKLMEESLGTAAAASAGETSASAAVGEAGQAKEEQPQKEDTVVTKLEKRIQKMITQIDEQLDAYDKEVYDKLQHFDCADGKISVLNLRSAFEQIRHRPDDETITALIDKLDVDHDGFVPLEDVTSLAEVEGLGVVIDDAADQIVGETEELRKTEGITDLLGSAASSLSSKLKGSETAESKKEEKTASTPKKPKREEIVE